MSGHLAVSSAMPDSRMRSLPLAPSRGDQAPVRELVVVSGKGGTGKTSLLASFAALARDAVLADCDVDAADLHLVLGPRVEERHVFSSGHDAVIRERDCTGCGDCVELCRFDAIAWADGAPSPVVDPIACEGCGVCVHLCPARAIDFESRRCGEWFISETRWGPMVHARLGIAAENSGKLVTTVRNEARRVAAASDRDLILVDGPPGIGCPVIASITGASAVLAVAEPSVSGEHDVDRVLQLADHFKVPTAVCVNRWDLNPEVADRIEHRARERGGIIAGRVRYDPSVTVAQVRGISVLELGGGAANDIRGVFETVVASCSALHGAGTRPEGA